MTQLESTKYLAEFEAGIRLVFGKKYQDALTHFDQLLLQDGLDRSLARSVDVYRNVCLKKLAPQPPAAKSVDEILDSAMLHLNRHETAPAEEILNRARKKESENDYFHYLDAVLQCQKNGWEQAVKALRKAVELNPVNRHIARNDADFEPLRHMDEFKRLTSS